MFLSIETEEQCTSIHPNRQENFRVSELRTLEWDTINPDCLI